MLSTSADDDLTSSPFHAAVGILTVRMLLNLRKATANDIYGIAADSNDTHVELLQLSAEGSKGTSGLYPEFQRSQNQYQRGAWPGTEV